MTKARILLSPVLQLDALHANVEFVLRALLNMAGRTSHIPEFNVASVDGTKPHALREGPLARRLPYACEISVKCRSHSFVLLRP